MTAPKVDISGRDFHYLTVNFYDGNGKWNCTCKACGGEKLVRISALTHGKAKSCGCMAQILRTAASTKHGATKAGRVSLTYASWRKMIRRCYDKNFTAYKYYGAKGIRVYKPWRESFEAFREALGERPSSKHSLDRLDCYIYYQPGNCRWATRREQDLNRRNTIRLKFDGRTQPLLLWAEEIGIPYQTLVHRLKRGWIAEKTLTTPVKKTARWPQA